MADYIYKPVANLTFAAATVGSKFYDLRNIVGFGALQVTAKVDTGSAQKIVAVNLVTGQTINIPKNDFWAYSI
jgi:hypothetical protein